MSRKATPKYKVLWMQICLWWNTEQFERLSHLLKRYNEECLSLSDGAVLLHQPKKQTNGKHYIQAYNTANNKQMQQPVFRSWQFSHNMFKSPRLTEERAAPRVSEALNSRVIPPWSNLGKTSAQSPGEWWGWRLTRRGNGLGADQACFIYCMW